MNGGYNPDLIKTGLDNVFFGGYDVDTHPAYANATNGLIFMSGTATNSAVISNVMGMPGLFTDVNEEEPAVEATIRSDHKRTSNVKNFKRNIPISKEFFDDEEHGAVSKQIMNLGKRARTSQDDNALDVYRDGFTTATVNSGTVIFSDSHTALSGDTVDNLETGAISHANLVTMQNSLADQKAQDGELGGHLPAFLLVPTALFDNAIEITKSTLQSGTSDNELNYFSEVFPGLQVFFSPLLGANYGGSDTAYFMGSKMHSLTRYVREGLYTRLVGWEYDELDRFQYKAGFREVVFADSYEGLVGSTGAA